VSIPLAVLEAITDGSGIALRIEVLPPAGVRHRQLRVRTLIPGMLLALADRRPRDGRIIAPALDYLRRALPSTRAAASIGWGVLGLKAHEACPPDADTWLAEAYEHGTGKPDATVGLGLLLLAAGPRGCLA